MYLQGDLVEKMDSFGFLFLFLFGFGSWLFMSGFFMARFELKNKSTCEGKCPEKHYDRIVVLLIDALRFDYTLFDPELGESVVHYQVYLIILGYCISCRIKCQLYLRL